MNTHTQFNRQALLNAYIDRILDDMSTKDLMRIVGDYIEDNLSEYTDAQLITEIENDYPELLVSLDVPRVMK
jgi:hypothetical protein